MARHPIWHVYIFEPVKVLHLVIIMLTYALPHICKSTLNTKKLLCKACEANFKRFKILNVFNN